MLLGGLWHGASWTFVAWGAFHGAIQVGYRALRLDRLVERWRFLDRRGFAVQTASWALTMILVCIGWILFRARSFADALAVGGNLLQTTGYTVATFSTLFGFAAPLIAVEIYQRATGRLEFLTVGPFLLRYTAAMTVLLAILAFSAAGDHAFIYFDF
jgi:D-alanyl-lipoteichoic acid acyltransferase DltB (MBOAT superfamily)